MHTDIKKGGSRETQSRSLTGLSEKPTMTPLRGVLAATSPVVQLHTVAVSSVELALLTEKIGRCDDRYSLSVARPNLLCKRRLAMGHRHVEN